MDGRTIDVEAAGDLGRRLAGIVPTERLAFQSGASTAASLRSAIEHPAALFRRQLIELESLPRPRDRFRFVLRAGPENECNTKRKDGNDCAEHGAD
jgi:hypothetical protein